MKMSHTNSIANIIMKIHIEITITQHMWEESACLQDALTGN